MKLALAVVVAALAGAGAAEATGAPALRPVAVASQAPHADLWWLAWLDEAGKLVVHDTRTGSRRRFSVPSACPRAQLEAHRSRLIAFQCEDGTLRVVSAASGRELHGRGLDLINAEQRSCRPCHIFLYGLGRHWLWVSLGDGPQYLNWRTGAGSRGATTVTTRADLDSPRLIARTCAPLPRVWNDRGSGPELGSYWLRAGWIIRDAGELELGRCGVGVRRRLPGCLPAGGAVPHAFACTLYTHTHIGIRWRGLVDVYSLPRLRRTRWDVVRRFRGLTGVSTALTPRWFFVSYGGVRVHIRRARIPR
jgi:hypothetical protein